MLKRNLISNYIGQGWNAIMSIAFVPMYIKYLGIENYGIIGIYAMIQTWMSLLDMGMKPALSREMARFTGGAHNSQSIWNLLRSIEIITFTIALLIAVGICTASGWLASEWVQSGKIPLSVVREAFVLMGMVIACGFIETLYSSSLAGLQKQLLQNIVLVIMTTIRVGGSIGILMWISPTINCFFVWQGIVSLLTVVFFMISVYRVLPFPPRRAKFSISSIKEIWFFAAGMTGITLLVLLLTQVDKILLSRLLTLDAFGYYILAGNASAGLRMLVSPISTALSPKFNELIINQDFIELNRLYHQGAQLVTVIMGSAAVVLMVFADRILFLWTGDPVLTKHTSPIMSLLALGTLLNGFMWIPYQIQLAHGWTSLTITINIVAVTILVPAIFLVTPIYGAMGTAWVWVVLNAGYLFIGVHFMHLRILKGEKWSWFCFDIIIPLVAAGFTALLCRCVLPDHLGRLGDSFIVLGSSLVTITIATLFAPLIMGQVHKYMMRWHYK